MTTADAFESAAAARSAANIGDNLSRSALAAQFRDAAAMCVGTSAGLATAAIEVQLRIDPTLVGDLHLAQQTLDRIAELIAAGDVHAASLAVAS